MLNKAVDIFPKQAKESQIFGKLKSTKEVKMFLKFCRNP